MSLATRVATDLAMDLRRPFVRAGALAVAMAALLGVYFGVARPWFRRWGATDAEVRMALPGDDIVPGADTGETRAITIAAPAPVVWAWVAQIGQDRGGFYSYRVLEDLFGCEMPDLPVLDPRLQHWAVGEKLWMYPPRKLGGIGFATLVDYQPGRALGFATRGSGGPPSLSGGSSGSWTFVVEPSAANATRLIFRGRARGERHALPAAFRSAVFEPVHFAMERRTLTGIKTLAEGGRPSRLRDNVQVSLWAVVFVAFWSSAVLVLAGRRPGRHLVTLLASGLLFQLLTLVQPSPYLGLALVAATLSFPWLHPGP